MRWVCRRGVFVAGVRLSWGGFVLGRVCRGEGLSGVGLSRVGFVWGGFVGVPAQVELTSQRSNPQKKAWGPVFLTKAPQICLSSRFRGFWGC